jgi:hypothetical protein
MMGAAGPGSLAVDGDAAAVDVDLGVGAFDPHAIVNRIAANSCFFTQGSVAEVGRAYQLRAELTRCDEGVTHPCRSLKP